MSWYKPCFACAFPKKISRMIQACSVQGPKSCKLRLFTLEFGESNSCVTDWIYWHKLDTINYDQLHWLNWTVKNKPENLFIWKLNLNQRFVLMFLMAATVVIHLFTALMMPFPPSSVPLLVLLRYTISSLHCRTLLIYL